MPAAAIAGVGAVAGGVASGKGASKAAKIQAQATAQQTAALQAMYNTNRELMTPTFDRGESAQARIQTMLGLSGGDGANAQKILSETPGYQFALRQSLGAVNANAYASGQGNSGAAQKLLMDRGNSMATMNYNNYVNQLGTVADRGVSAMNGLVSQGNYTTAATNQVTQSGADNAAANAVFQGNNIANVIKGVSGAAGQAFGSSYAAPTAPVNNAGGTPINQLFQRGGITGGGIPSINAPNTGFSGLSVMGRW